MRAVVIGLAIAVALWLVAIGVLVLLGRRSAARELATLIPNVVVLFRGLLKDERVSRGSKAWLVFAVVWLVSPIDLVPEFIPVAGPLDDAIVAALVLRFVLRRTDRDVVESYWRGDPRTLDRLAGRPR
jgi:uncharacterized membrane protein YkvA (DUF1232 family)